MLQHAAVYPGTLALLKRLMELPSLAEMNLVGGTALALQLGHRISIDLDLFGSELPDKNQFLSELNEPVQPLSDQDYFYAFKVRDIKVDVLRFPYPLIRPIVEMEGIRMASLEDVAAMKIIAVSNRGSKKDFFDIAVLLKQFSLNEILDFFKEKTKKELPFYVLKSLCYFDDAETEFDPEVLIDLTWEDVKSKVVAAVENIYKG
ncbi:MAG: nucleotidyl transferase AbiEii/AbiGii toxin family protein [Bacteroidia bacterium]|nr:nucleotidyl transferase AbiEii/AbiGii toxin family protein [Bacteroidia bacterium]